MKNIASPALLAFATTLLACGGPRIHIDSDQAAVKNDSIKVSANWIKDKGSKYDVELAVRNVSERPIIIFLADMKCARGKAEGTLKHSFFNTGERTIDFKGGEAKTFRMVCQIGHESDGAYRVTVAKVYDNPSGDGVRTDKVVAKELVWSHAGAF